MNLQGLPCSKSTWLGGKFTQVGGASGCELILGLSPSSRPVSDLEPHRPPNKTCCVHISRASFSTGSLPLPPDIYTRVEYFQAWWWLIFFGTAMVSEYHHVSSKNLVDEHPTGRVPCFLLTLCVTRMEIVGLGHIIVKWSCKPGWIMVGSPNVHWTLCSWFSLQWSPS